MIISIQLACEIKLYFKSDINLESCSILENTEWTDTQSNVNAKVVLDKVKQVRKTVSIFTAALFTIAGTWTQPECSSTDERTKK